MGNETTAVYVQAAGELTLYARVDEGPNERQVYRCVGFAGRLWGRNNPDVDHARGVGPLPAGVYRVGLEPHPRFRAPAFRLTPMQTNNMFGRSGFWIHGGTESHGCIILPKIARLALETYGLQSLTVVDRRLVRTPDEEFYVPDKPKAGT